MRQKERRGQFQLSYGMIFSIILIIVFLVVAFYAIFSFLKTGCTTETAQTISDLQKTIDEIWGGAGIENFTFRRTLGGNCGVEYYCFYNPDATITDNYRSFVTSLKTSTDSSGNKKNLYLYPQKSSKIPSVYLKHITLGNLKDNPYCIKINKKILEIRLNKGIREALVSVN